MPEFNEKAMRQFNDNLIKEFRTNGGKVNSGPFVNAPLMLLTTTGAKSGRPFTTPLVYTKDGNRIVIIASKGGFPKHPAWFHNLKANPTVELEIGTKKFKAKATITSGAERQRLFDAQAKVMPQFNDYQKATTRVIPVIAMEPIE